jgi:hypothetical protein
MEVKQPRGICENCESPVEEGQSAVIREGRIVAHRKCDPDDLRMVADKVDLAIDDWKLNKKY